MMSPNIMSTHPLLADRVRLSIMVALAGSKVEIEFTNLLQLLGVTKGNLSAHLRKLEDAGLVKVHKGFVERRPRSTYSCTENGKNQIRRYLHAIEEALRTAIQD